MAFALSLTSLSLTWSVGAIAQERHSDFQIWTSTSATAGLGERAEVQIDGLVQTIDDASRTGRELIRTVILAKLDDRVRLGGGYVWTQILPAPGQHWTEHRAVQEFDFRSPRARGALILAVRTQMEERWRVRLKGTSLRWRQLTRLEAPFGRGGISAVAWDEYFHEFRQADWSGRAGPSLMLNFVGVHLPVGRSFAIEPGYLNQTQFDRGRNRVRHALALYATARF